MGSYVICQYCNEKLEEVSGYHTEHIEPKNPFTHPYFNNLLTSCANCNMLLAPQPTEFEFITFLSDLMRGSGEYSEISQEAIIGKERRHRADILAIHKRRPHKPKLLIECQSTSHPLSRNIDDVIKHLHNYVTIYGDCQPILAIPGNLSEEDSAALKAAGIALWDLDFIAYNFKEQLPNLELSYYKSLVARRVLRGPALTREDQLIEKLKSCDPGKRDWSLYQELVGDILEHLFCPPLKKPLPEHADKTKTNRRDFILPNYAENGFWHVLQRNYMADFVVADAKNYSRKIGKNEILQVANYLKPRGAGLFGMIFSRHGCDAAGGMHTLREQWLLHGKLILVLSDEEVCSMLIAMRDIRKPEYIVEEIIEQFRLSI